MDDLINVIHRRLSAAITQSRNYAIEQMRRRGVPVGVDAVRCDISFRTSKGWEPTINGEIVELRDEAS